MLKKFYGPICQIDDVITFQKSAHKNFSTHSVATGPGDLEPPRDPLNTPRILARSNESFFQNELVFSFFSYFGGPLHVCVDVKPVNPQNRKF